MLWINLRGPMQSYGGQGAIGGIRRTSPWPTKSSIVSMIAVAGGFGGNHDMIDELCGSVGMSAHIVSSSALRGRNMQDFQTVSGRVEIKDDKASRPKGISPVVVKQYISDASFYVSVRSTSMDSALEWQIEKWLDHPAGVIHLGRANCPPSIPVVVLHGNLVPKQRQIAISLVECLPADEGAYDAHDNYQSSRYRSFAPRWVREKVCNG